MKNKEITFEPSLKSYNQNNASDLTLFNFFFGRFVKEHVY